jgi:hypothetical protein
MLLVCLQNVRKRNDTRTTTAHIQLNIRSYENRQSSIDRRPSTIHNAAVRASHAMRYVYYVQA